MNSVKKSSKRSVLGLAFLVAVAAPIVPAQDNTSPNTSTTQTGTRATTRTVANNERAKITGIIVERAPDTFTVRDANGADTVVRLTDDTRVTERESNPFRRGRNYGVTNILRGLRVEVQGRGDNTGQLVADRVRFTENELRVARAIEARVDPVEGRVGSAESRIGQVEENAQRLSGQLDELAAVSNAARGGAKAAQETADLALVGVRETNDRISALDDYAAQQTAVVNFRTGSATLSPEARTQLDQIATGALQSKGYIVEITGFADATGDTNTNRRLSQRRADAVVRYLVENHPIPLRRITTPFGYGEAQPVAENTTREGRAQNRRVEVKLLVSRGLTQPAPNTQAPATNTTGTGTDSQ